MRIFLQDFILEVSSGSEKPVYGCEWLFECEARWPEHGGLGCNYSSDNVRTGRLAREKTCIFERMTTLFKTLTIDVNLILGIMLPDSFIHLLLIYDLRFHDSPVFHFNKKKNIRKVK